MSQTTTPSTRANHIFRGAMFVLSCLLTPQALAERESVQLIGLIAEQGSPCPSVSTLQETIMHRKRPDGSTSAEPFEIPWGKWLKVTDFVWQTKSQSSTTPFNRLHRTARAKIYGPRFDGSDRPSVFGSQAPQYVAEGVLITPELVDARGFAGRDNLHTPATIGGGRVVCVVGEQVGLTRTIGQTSIVEIAHARIFGYLVDAGSE